jgi:uncharacterized delta-60 repeat protein
MRSRCLGLFLAISVALLGIATTAGAAGPGAGRLDRSFGQGGGAVFPPVSPNQVGQDMAVGPGDEIFTLQQSIGCGATVCTPHLFVERFSPDGVLDPGFGSAGVSEVAALAGSFSFGSRGSLAIAPDGGVVAAAASGNDINLVRFLPGGSLDRGFGSGGVVISDFGGTEIHPQVTVQPDGRILLASELALDPRGERFTVVSRYLPNGAVDTSFGDGAPGAGAATGALAIGKLVPGALAISSAGGIVLGLNRGCCSMRSRVFAGRRDANGQPRRWFASGAPWHQFKLGRETLVSSVVALPNGKIYLVGTTETGAYALKLLPSGRLDRTFGRSGVIRMKAIGRAPVALADDAGRLVVAGSRLGDSEFEPAPLEGAWVVRRNPNGRPDPGWAGGRAARISSGGPANARINVPVALGAQSSGGLVVLGEWNHNCVRSCPPPGTGMLRLLGGR